MKPYSYVLASLFLSQLSWGAESFSASAKWSKSNPTCLSTIYFSELEAMGVRFDAESRAVQKCHQAGYLICYGAESNLTSCNATCGPTSCEAAASVFGMNK